MRIQIQPNKYTCLVTSLAMLIDEDVNTLIRRIGHDGCQEVNQIARSYHVQELVDVCYNYYGISLLVIERVPLLDLNGHKFSVYDIDTQHTRIRNYLSNPGVLIDYVNSHAVAWDGDSVYNPTNGTIEKPWSIGCIDEMLIVG